MKTAPPVATPSPPPPRLADAITNQAGIPTPDISLFFCIFLDKYLEVSIEIRIFATEKVYIAINKPP
jgi:hypothetical protein